MSDRTGLPLEVCISQAVRDGVAPWVFTWSGLATKCRFEGSLSQNLVGKSLVQGKNREARPSPFMEFRWQPDPRENAASWNYGFQTWRGLKWIFGIERLGRPNRGGWRRGVARGGCRQRRGWCGLRRQPRPGRRGAWRYGNGFWQRKGRFAVDRIRPRRKRIRVRLDWRSDRRFVRGADGEGLSGLGLTRGGERWRHIRDRRLCISNFCDGIF
jgi:hypothetical protein